MGLGEMAVNLMGEKADSEPAGFQTGADAGRAAVVTGQPHLQHLLLRALTMCSRHCSTPPTPTRQQWVATGRPGGDRAAVPQLSPAAQSAWPPHPPAPWMSTFSSPETWRVHHVLKSTDLGISPSFSSTLRSVLCTE